MSEERRILALGKAGTGKSSVANTIYGEDVFKVGHTFTSETKIHQAETRDVGGRRLTLIDTPGFFDMDRPEETIREEIVRCITECAAGIHAFLLVLKVERFTKHENAIIKKIRKTFSDEALKYTTVIFTHGDQLEEQKKIEDLVSKNENVKNLVDKCGGRCHVVDNKYWRGNQQDEYRSNQFQVGELLNTIETMVEDHQGGCYTNEMLQEAEKMKKEEEERIRQSSNRRMTDEGVQTEAKENVFKRLLKKLKGVAIGALLGALLGAVTAANLVPVAPIVAGAVGGAVGAVVGAAVGYEQGERTESVTEAVANTSTAVPRRVSKNLKQKQL